MPDEVAYRWSLWRFASAMAVIGLAGATVAWFLLSVLFSALTGQLKLPPVSDGIFFVGLYGFFFTVFSVYLARKKPSWLRFGDETIELAAERRNVVEVPYPSVLSVRVRLWWPVSVLDVVVGDDEQVAVHPRGGRQPLRRRQGERVRFSLPLAGLDAPAAAVRSELRRRQLP